MYIYDILFFSPLPCNFLQDSLSNVYRWAVNYKEACFQKAKLKDFIIRKILSAKYWQIFDTNFANAFWIDRVFFYTHKHTSYILLLYRAYCNLKEELLILGII